MGPLCESSLTTSTILKLEARRSYMAKSPFQQHKTKRKFLSDAAMRLHPATWFAPALIRAHDKYEYKRDRKYLQDVYVEYQSHKIQKNSFIGANGSGSVVDLRTYLAPVERTALEEEYSEWDPWVFAGVVLEDPWQLLPVEEMI